VKASRRTRAAAVTAAAVTAVAASGIIGWRVLRPSQVVTPARAPYPTAATIPVPGAVGALTAAPLIVQQRLRVFADERHVWSDTPPDFHYQQSPFWSFRRWPAQLIGVVVSENGPTDTGRPIVVTAWSDGTLVGIAADTGEVAWQVEADPLGSAYTGRRTGAATVYRPPGLFTAAGRIIVSSDSSLAAYDPATGARLWSTPPLTPAECAGPDLTTTGGQYLRMDTCEHRLLVVSTADGTPHAPLEAGPAAPAGSNATASVVEPLGCLVGHSDCTGLRLTSGGTGAGWLMTQPTAVPAARLADAGSLLAGPPDAPVALSPGNGLTDHMRAHDPVTGAARWTWTAPDGEQARVIATGTDRVILLSADGQELIAVSTESGLELSRSSATLYFEPQAAIELGHVYTAGHYVVLERLTPGAPDTAGDAQYYAYFRPTLLAAT
jgi:outer membrane protein assembly factor BamB